MQRGGPQRQEPDDVIKPGGVLRAHAAAARARDRRLHPRAQVLQRAGGDPARPLRGGVREPRAARAARRARPARAARPARRARRARAARRAPAAAARAARAQRRAQVRARPLHRLLGYDCDSSGSLKHRRKCGSPSPGSVTVQKTYHYLSCTSRNVFELWVLLNRNRNVSHSN